MPGALGAGSALSASLLDICPEPIYAYLRPVYTQDGLLLAQSRGPAFWPSVAPLPFQIKSSLLTPSLLKSSSMSLAKWAPYEQTNRTTC
jgi:hypothetical protein